MLYLCTYSSHKYASISSSSNRRGCATTWSLWTRMQCRWSSNRRRLRRHRLHRNSNSSSDKITHRSLDDKTDMMCLNLLHPNRTYYSIILLSQVWCEILLLSLYKYFNTFFDYESIFGGWWLWLFLNLVFFSNNKSFDNVCIFPLNYLSFMVDGFIFFRPRFLINF